MTETGLAPQLPIRTLGARKHDLRTQFAALCYRRHKRHVEILLITGRESGRWGLPRGWPMDKLTPAAAAACEAYEEAGVEGEPGEAVIGLYTYRKSREKNDLPCIVSVFGLEVRKLLKSYPEKGQRRRKWFRADKAAAKIREPELREIILGFARTVSAR